ncbi:MAG TPA: branched-chain amino acid ABC transporter permease [Burkholderiaceae bacterium]|nr:branched-chain amino acid ABC transporter permease [Burkholderiaceae bacterium]
MFAELFSIAYQFADVFAFLILSAAGLAIIFGMMGIINLAHGEFITCGIYVTVIGVQHGLPLPIAQALGALAAGLIGIVLERTVIYRLYDRPLDSILATWGISLIVTQGMLVTIGSTWPGIGTPAGSFQVGEYTFSTYRLWLFLAAVLVMAGLYLLYMKTSFGVLSRATIQNPRMARALGVRTPRIYAASFGIGAALAGLCGALYAPTMTLIPTMGVTFIVEAFVTVVVGGSNVLLGTVPAAVVLGVIRTALNAWQGQIIGQIGMLIAVILVIRVLPEGVSGWLARRSR